MAPSPDAEELRRQLVRLKIETLSAQARRMGLSGAGDGVSDKAKRTIEESVAGLSLEELQKQVAHWMGLSQKVAEFKTEKPQ